MKRTLLDCLAQNYQTLLLEDACSYEEAPTPTILFCEDDKPLIAAGGLGRLTLGLPHLVWTGGAHTPKWSMKPVWTMPSDWTEPLDETQQAQVLAEAKLIARKRKRQYRRCNQCEERMMPEHMSPGFDGPKDSYTCHGCMTQMGVVF